VTSVETFVFKFSW